VGGAHHGLGDEAVYVYAIIIYLYIYIYIYGAHLGLGEK
jgi:hypothetical protein